MARCIVTGGAGFIGRHLVNYLLRRGNEVLVIDDLSNSESARVPVNCEWPGRMDIREVQFNHLLDAAVVFHLAAVSRTPPAINCPEHCVSVNVMGTLRLLEAARQAKVPRVVYSSSNVVYAAETPYKASKLAAEMLCDTYIQLYGLSVIKLRYSNVYGPGMRKGDLAVLASLRDSKLGTGAVKVTGDGEQSRDFTHVDDVVEANIKAWESTYTGAAIDICTGKNHTLNKTAKWFSCPVEHIEDRRGDIKHIHQDPRIAEEILGWRAAIMFEDGFPSIYE